MDTQSWFHVGLRLDVLQNVASSFDIHEHKDGQKSYQGAPFAYAARNSSILFHCEVLSYNRLFARMDNFEEKKCGLDQYLPAYVTIY